MSVFIEDTDAYGIVYNANYLRYYERALFDMVSDPERKHWPVVRVDKHRFRQSPPLGGDFTIVGEKVSESADEETWDVQMIHGDVVYNSAVITISSVLASAGPLRIAPGSATIQFDCPIYRDEFDANLDHRPPLRNVLNPFERARTTALGGPDSLRSLQSEEGLIFVVTSIDSAVLIDNDAVVCTPGTEITVTTSTKLLRRGMMVKFFQTMWANDKDGKAQRVAQGVVSVMTLDANTRKPTTALPDWLVELMLHGKRGAKDNECS